MSYILNALKKAEHDRLREEPEDLDDFVNSGWDPYEKTATSYGAYWLPVAIVVIAGGLFYGFSNLSPQVERDSAAAVLDVEKALKTQMVAEIVEPSPSDNPVVTPAPVLNTALPDVSITGHIFIRSGSRLNRIFVGESIYHVGDKLDSNWMIEAINSDSLELRSGTQVTELPLR